MAASKVSADRPWTTEEERYLREHAGIDHVREICRKLKRSRRSVEAKASRLRVSLRHCERLTVICPKCGEARAKAGGWTSTTGICEVCRKRAAYEDALRRQAEAFEDLDPAYRAVYSATDARTGASKVPPRPCAPDVSGLSPARAQRARELHAIDVEKWELYRLKLLTDAVKKRTQRMREKSGTNPRRFREDSKSV